MRTVRVPAVSDRPVAGLAIALVTGLMIGFMDSRPGWDDTGVTAVALVLAAGAAAFVAGRAPWLVAIAAGLWVPVFEVRDLSSVGPFAALVFAGVGAAVGWLATRR